MQIRDICTAAAVSCGLSLCIPFTILASESDAKALAIEERVDAMEQGFRTESRDMTLILVNAQGQKAERRLVYVAQEGKDGKDKTVLRFQYPTDVQGTALLTHEGGASPDQQWLYLPTLKRVKRIASANQSASFMGSEFSYEDLITRQLRKFDYRYLGEEVVSGKRCHMIEARPKQSDSGYSRIVRWRMTDNLQELKADFYDRRGDLLKQRLQSGHHKASGYWRVRETKVDNVQTGKSSVLKLGESKIGKPIPDRQFRVQTFGDAGA